MTLNEFTVALYGYKLRDEDEWDRTRNLIATFINFGGLGTTDPIKPTEVIELSKDTIDVIRPITSWEEAKRLIDKM